MHPYLRYAALPVALMLGDAAPARPPAPAVATATAPAATIRVDLRDAPRGLFHARLRFPVKPGPMTLVYPRWIPGDHLPAGPIENLAGLRFSAAGKTIPWRRDRLEPDAFHVVIPAGARTLDVELDFLAVPSLVTAINPSSNATTDNLAVLRWHVVTLYPRGANARTYRMRPSVVLPEGWRAATAMPGTAERDGAIAFPETTLEELVDSPLTAGRHMQTYPLATIDGAPVSAAVTADQPEHLALSPKQVADLAGAVRQARALFGPAPFRRYDFLITLSDALRDNPTIGGQEHLASSDNVGGARTFLDPAGRESVGDTLAHEFAHVWSGKYRRPAGEDVRDYQQPYDNSLLWVYEGLTSYLGTVLAARGGAWTADEFRDALANRAGAMAYRRGREWRSLMDTAIGLPALMRARAGWSDWRRGADYYPEGALLWLDVDLTIRRLSGDRRSLDDFSRRFFVWQPGDPVVKPYDMAEVVATLNAVQPHDWLGFFRDRLEAVGTDLPTAVFGASGWTLGYVTAPNAFAKAKELGGALDLTWSLGLTIGGDARIGYIVHGSPADLAGLRPDTTVKAIDGQPYGTDRLRTAIDAARTSRDPIRLTVTRAGGGERTVSITYRDGQRYPTLVRNPAVPDRLGAIARPLAVAP